MRERDIFIEALQQPPAARGAFVDEACESDADLRERVQSLLNLQSEARSFLKPDPFATVLAHEPTERPGSQIGPYKLLEQIGEGGFGIVFMAEQTAPVKRKVALKVIKPGMDTRQVIARFEAERQALALMDHPNIARILDAGTTDEGQGSRVQGQESLDSPPLTLGPAARPYFVMELVKGIPITEFCDQHRLATRERLKLFFDVCHAVQHAHQKGVIHRDLKPSNLLVTVQDGRPLVKVIDFGIAKAMGQQLTDRTLFTGFAQLIGTPLYMSPEQAALSAVDVDTRSDVFSLGVLLYELLTGTTPFDKESLSKASYDELRRIIREDEPPRPSSRVSTLAENARSTIASRQQLEPQKLGHQLRGELDWIVMRALEKDRERRYESASALAADVERYLSDEPVQACPPSVWYRVQKFARRRKGLLTAASLVMFSLLGGTVVSTWQAIEAHVARDAAHQMFLAEAAEHKKSQRNLNLAVEAVDDMYYRLATTWIADNTAASNTQVHFLEKAATFYAQLVRDPQHYDLTPTRRAELHRRMALIHHKLRDFDAAVSDLQNAVTIQTELVERSPRDIDLRLPLATSLTMLGAMEGMQGRPEAAGSHYEAAVAHYESLARQQPDNERHRIGMARIKQNLAMARSQQRQGPEALRLTREAGALYEELGVNRLMTLGEFENYLTTQASLVRLLVDQSEPGEAEIVARAALGRCEGRVLNHADDQNLRTRQAYLLGELAYALLALERDAEARPLLQRQLEIQVQLLSIKRDPFTFLGDMLYRRAAGQDEPAAWDDWITAMVRLAGVEQRLGQLHAAEIRLGKATQVASYLDSLRGDALRHRIALVNTYAHTALLLRDRYPEEADQHLTAAAARWRDILHDFPDAGVFASSLHSREGDLAWFVTMFPEFDFTDPAVAQRLDAAGELEATLIPGRRTGILYALAYDDWQTAERTAELLIGLRSDGALDQFLLSIALAHLNRRDEARQWFDAGADWMDAHAHADDELTQFRQAAQSALDESAAPGESSRTEN